MSLLAHRSSLPLPSLPFNPQFAGRIFVVLPAYNEPGIGDLIQRINVSLEGKFHFTVIVVNDGSQDDTATQVKASQSLVPVLLFEHPVNLGLGPTIRDGLMLAAQKASDGDIVISLDADETQPPEIIPLLVEKIAEGNDVVIASRFQKGARVEGLGWNRKLFSLVAAGIFKLVMPIDGVRDYTCGFRAYRASILQEAFQEFGTGFIDQPGFQSMVDILLKLKCLRSNSSHRLTFAEVPFVLGYDKKQGASKMPVKSTIVATLVLLFKRRFQRKANFIGESIPSLEEANC